MSHSGSNRSTGSQQRRNNDSRRDRSRSRSSSSSSSSTSSDGRHSPAPQSRRRERNEHRSNDDVAAAVQAPPPPVISRGRGFAIGGRSAMAPPTHKVLPVHMKLSSGKPAEGAKKITVASAFCNDSDEDEDAEQMPAECRMRMRNIGRETPTSSGPNSFGKTKQGFCDSQKIIEKNLKETSAMKK